MSVKKTSVDVVGVAFFVYESVVISVVAGPLEGGIFNASCSEEKKSGSDPGGSFEALMCK